MNRLGAERRPFLFVIDYKQEQVIVEEPDQIDSEALLYNLDGVTNVVTASRMNDRENRTSAIRWETFPITQSAYADSFHKVVGHIRAGNSYLVNLTCATPVRTDLSLKDVFVSSEARYKLWMKDRFVVFSPEIFVKIRDEHIYSYPMKGTIDATLPDARRRILEDPKETAEHATIVDLIRNDLSMVATEVMVTRYRYIDELPTHQGALLQVSSEIRGRLTGGWQAEVGDLFHLVHQIQEAQRRHLRRHRHDKQDDGERQLAQLEVVGVDGVGRQGTEVNRQRRTGRRNDEAVAQAAQNRHVGIVGGVVEVGAEAGAGQRVKALLDGKIVVGGVDDEHIEEEQADKAQYKQHNVSNCTLQRKHRVVNFRCLGLGGCGFGLVWHTLSRSFLNDALQPPWLL